MKKNLSPLEGMYFESKIALPMLIIAIILLFFTRGFLWVASLIVTFIVAAYLALRIYQRTKEAWVRIHYPAMIRYNRLSGFILGSQTNPLGTSEPTSVVSGVLQMLVSSVYPDMSKNDATSFVSKALQKLSSHYDKERIYQFLIKMRPDWPESKRNEFLHSLLTELNKSDNYPAHLRYVISEIIEHEYGLVERAKYMEACLLNKAN